MSQDINPYSAPSGALQEARATGEEAPALWNPNAAASWSLLFSPVFGAYLQMRNWQALGDSEKAAVSWHWCIGTLVATLLALGLVLVVPDSHWSSKLLNRSGLAILLAWYFGNGKLQAAYVKERFGKDYPRKGWGLPLLIAFGALAALLVVVVGLYVALASIGVITAASP